MDVFILILELIGAAAFAVSGAMTGIRKNMDIFGACVLGLTVAVGGGITRDIILGAFPPAMFHDPIYAITAILTCFIVFIPRIRTFLEGNSLLMLLADSIGLGIFTVSGAARAFAVTTEANVFLAVFVGVITAPGHDGRRPAVYFRQAYLCDCSHRRRTALLFPAHNRPAAYCHAQRRDSDRRDPPFGVALPLEPAEARAS